MARPSDPRIEPALGRVSPGAVRSGAGLWRLALASGSVATVTARATTDWLELTSPLPADTDLPGDRWALLLNAELHGAARLVRRFADDQPHVRADVAFDHREDVDGALTAACLDLAHARHVAHSGPDGPQAPWSARAGESTDLVTRAGTYRALVEESGHHARVIVELADLSGYSDHAIRAASALLVTLGAAVPGLAPALHQRGQDLVAVCAAPLRAPSGHHLERALVALSAACEASGRELRALRCHALASEYLERAAWARNDSPQQLLLEEQSCMQP